METVYLGIKGHIVCLDKESGSKQWATKLNLTSGVTNVYLDDDKLFAYSGGHLFCLRSDDGEILWENKLNGFGYGACIIATKSQNSSVITDQPSMQQVSAIAAAASISNTEDTSSSE